jgi:hypothetical protein
MRKPVASRYPWYPFTSVIPAQVSQVLRQESRTATGAFVKGIFEDVEGVDLLGGFKYV